MRLGASHYIALCLTSCLAPSALCILKMIIIKYSDNVYSVFRDASGTLLKHVVVHKNCLDDHNQLQGRYPETHAELLTAYNLSKPFITLC